MNYRAFIEYSTSLRKIVGIIQERIHGYVPLILDVLLKWFSQNAVMLNIMYDTQTYMTVNHYISIELKVKERWNNHCIAWNVISMPVQVSLLNGPQIQSIEQTDRSADQPQRHQEHYYDVSYSKTLFSLSSLSRWEWETVDYSLDLCEKD